MENMPVNNLHRKVPEGGNSGHKTEMIPESPIYIKSNNCVNLLITMLIPISVILPIPISRFWAFTIFLELESVLQGQ